jgi:protein-L-isoaspartate O-methyltransferase
MKTHERFTWAVDLLDIKSGDHIMEVGCGVGFAVEEIAARLTTGKIMAIDKSAVMIAKASERNKDSVQAGKVKFIQTDLARLEHGGNSFNKIFCFNINLFWTNNSISKEAAILKSRLAKNGSLYIFYGPMVASGLSKIQGPIVKNLEKENFKVVEIVYERRLNCCCFISAIPKAKRKK